jgi:hypothetical protein
MNLYAEIRVPTWSCIAVIALSLPITSVQAQEHCRLDNPQVVSASGAYQLKVTVACQQAASAQTVRYPAGPLSIGVTLFKIPLPGLRNRVVPVVESEAAVDDVTFTYIPSVEIGRPAATKEVAIPLGDVGTNTHILLAVWDKSTKCDAGDQSKGCTTSGVKLGEMDSFELPVPIDAWPRPVCNVEQLASRGFFRWAETEGDFGGPQVPERFAKIMATNDCFMRFPNRPGLGFSVLRWRAQPLPNR